MENINQIIGFIDPIKFNTLLGDKGASFGFCNFNDDGEYIFLGGNKLVLFVDIEGEPFVSEFDVHLAKAAKIILIPDERLVEFCPDFDFKVLIHSNTKTKFPHHFSFLKENSMCKACHEDREEINTTYDEISKFIGIGGEDTYNKIWNSIPEFDNVLEAKLELLHNCLHHESAPSELEPILSDYQEDYYFFKKGVVGKDFFNKDYIDHLTKLRIVLLGT